MHIPSPARAERANVRGIMRLLARIAAPLTLGLALVATGPRASEAAPGAKTAKTEPTKDKGKKDKVEPKKGAEKRPKGALSAGAPNKGRLYGGEKLASSKSVEVRGGGHAYGLPDLVRVLRRAAAKVSGKHKGSVLYVGDLSAKNGGALFGHNSHQSGRDADVGFYMVSEKGKHVNPHRFVAFGSDGRPRGGEVVRFDDERNWAFVEALLTDTKTDVRYLFVSAGLRTRLLKYAAKKNVSKELYTKAASVLMSPADADVHDDHFHVRIACPERMKSACVEESHVRGGGGGSAASAANAAGARSKDAKGEPAPKEEAGEAKEEKEAKEAAPPPPVATKAKKDEGGDKDR
ncbi:penicillin-insensitive murein endopeptidase [Polyangium jinanense]|uniref:penicillin-insensitive murein endopeptidase n=1 Tax=Polyangium jinanense TaxID=2829994 RepID=UPI002342479B|nr:penicillin-insensitive murein endopeptidase [Polyangium jinanense]MDC3952377.1 penicillin-insensitive murein endopeptidase [Polyangium jinanense]